MVAVADQLVWECIKKNNAFLKKKNGSTKRSGKVEFSSEAGNVKSLNKFQYSGIANSQAVSVICTEDNKTQLVKKSASKSGTETGVRKINVKKDFRRSVNVIAKQTTDVFYRRDLKDAVLGKYTKVYQANRRAAGITKPVPCKKGRGTN